MIIAHLSHNTITSSSEEAFSLYEKSRWGEKKQNSIEYAPVEAFSLITDGKMEFHAAHTKLDQHKALSKLRRLDKNIETKHVVFSDLRKRGYIVKTALKFGAEFRVYEKGVKPGEDHAVWLLYPVKEHQNQTWYDFAAKMRVATSTKKKLLIAIVDNESDVTYYEVSWLRP